LAKKFDFHHLISSIIGKQYVAEHNDPQTLKQKDRFDKGLLFDPKWILDVMIKKTKEVLSEREHDCSGIIFDGSPRTLYEAKIFYKYLIDLVGEERVRAIVLNVDEIEARKRLKKRLICNTNGRHVFTRSEELVPGVPCPKDCEGFLAERDLDKKEIFDVRMATYKKETMPALDYLRETYGVLEIDGEQGIEKVQEDIIKGLKLND